MLLDAAAELIAEQGFAAVSHRAVAERAGLPLAATTYYFSSLEELLKFALHQLADQWLQHAHAALAQLPPTLPTPRKAAAAVLTVAGVTTGGAASGDVLAMYDRYLEAGRHPQLRPIVVAYNAALETLLGQVLERAGITSRVGTARLVLAQVDGAALRALAEGTAVRRAALTATAALIELLAVNAPCGSG